MGCLYCYTQQYSKDNEYCWSEFQKGLLLWTEIVIKLLAPHGGGSSDPYFILGMPPQSSANFYWWTPSLKPDPGRLDPRCTVTDVYDKRMGSQIWRELTAHALWMFPELLDVCVETEERVRGRNCSVLKVELSWVSSLSWHPAAVQATINIYKLIPFCSFLLQVEEMIY